MDQVYPPAQMGRHGRGHHRPAALGREGGAASSKPPGAAKGKPARDAVLPWFTDARDPARIWANGPLRPARPDCPDPAAAPAGLQALAPDAPRHAAALPGLWFHALALTPLAYWALPLGLLQAGLLTLGSAAALWSLAGGIGLAPAPRRAYPQRAAAGPGRTHHWRWSAPCPIAGQATAPDSSAFVRFDRAEGAHPFTIASAPGALGENARGEALLRLVIKPLGDYTRTLARRLQAGQGVDIRRPLRPL